MARYALNLPTTLKQEAEQLADVQGISLNQFILWAVAEKVGVLGQRQEALAFPRIAYRRGASGQRSPMVRGTAIRVQTLVVAQQKWQLSPEQIAAQYELSEADVREALAFYQAHRAEIDASLAAEGAIEDQHG